MDNSLPPVPDIVRSAYATLIVTSLTEARRFWGDLLGLRGWPSRAACAGFRVFWHCLPE